MTAPTAEPMPTTATAETGNRARVRRYRAKFRRIDYPASPEALAVIQRRAAESGDCLAGTIDKLILAGDKAMSGHGRRGADETGES